ncbi:MAG: response regulator, partial [Pseudomonadales bacterium]|nr:response regulator [Pseudomonadales bacterium]
MVDDSADVLETLKMLLEMEDAQVTAFDHPVTALDAAKSTRFDIISDMDMPVMNGHELMSALRQLPHHFRSMNGLWSKAQRLLTFQCRSSARVIVVLALSCGQNKTPVRVS